MATAAAWPNGDNLEKEEINEAEREKKRKDERKVLTLTGLLMEGLDPNSHTNPILLSIFNVERFFKMLSAEIHVVFS